jgi:hypothetical protein
VVRAKEALLRVKRDGHDDESGIPVHLI